MRTHPDKYGTLQLGKAKAKATPKTKPKAKTAPFIVEPEIVKDEKDANKEAKQNNDKKDRKDKRDKKPKLLHFDCNFQEQRLGLGLAEPGPHQPTQHIWLQFISKDATEAIAQGVCVGDVVAEVAGIPVLGCTQIQLVSIIGAQKRPVQIRFARLPYT